MRISYFHRLSLTSISIKEYWKRAIMTNPTTTSNSTGLHDHNMYPNLNPDQSNPKIYYPYAERNKDVILNAISPYLQHAKKGKS